MFLVYNSASVELQLVTTVVLVLQAVDAMFKTVGNPLSVVTYAAVLLTASNVICIRPSVPGLACGRLTAEELPGVTWKAEIKGPSILDTFTFTANKPVVLTVRVL